MVDLYAVPLFIRINHKGASPYLQMENKVIDITKEHLNKIINSLPKYDNEDCFSLVSGQLPIFSFEKRVSFDEKPPLFTFNLDEIDDTMKIESYE